MSRSNTLYPSSADLHNGKFTNGIPDQGVPASLVKSETLNLILDNLEEAIKAAGVIPDNIAGGQLQQTIECLSGRYWHTGVNYKRGDTPIYNSTQYLCTNEHTATAANAPGQSGAPWEVLANESSISGAIQDAKTAANNNLNNSLTAVIAAAKQQATTANNNLHNSLTAAIAAAKQQALEAAWPIGSVYINAFSSSNPAHSTLLGFGTWNAVAKKFEEFMGENYSSVFFERIKIEIPMPKVSMEAMEDFMISCTRSVNKSELGNWVVRGAGKLFSFLGANTDDWGTESITTHSFDARRARATLKKKIEEYLTNMNKALLAFVEEDLVKEIEEVCTEVSNAIWDKKGQLEAE